MINYGRTCVIMRYLTIKDYRYIRDVINEMIKEITDRFGFINMFSRFTFEVNEKTYRKIRLSANTNNPFIGLDYRIDEFMMDDNIKLVFDLEHNVPKLSPLNISVQLSTPKIKRVIFNNPATIVYWGDGTKTVVKCQLEDDFDEEKGLAMAFFKKCNGNNGKAYDEMKKWIPEVKTCRDCKYVLCPGSKEPCNTCIRIGNGSTKDNYEKY